MKKLAFDNASLLHTHQKYFLPNGLYYKTYCTLQKTAATNNKQFLSVVVVASEDHIFLAMTTIQALCLTLDHMQIEYSYNIVHFALILS